MGAFEGYISVVLQYLTKQGIVATQKENTTSLTEIIDRAKDPRGVMI